MLSVVAGSRNDGHGQNLTERTQTFINGLAEQAERFQREVEIVLVEWNPPDDHSRLADILTGPARRHFQLRVVTVPPALHDQVPNRDRLPFFQMIAKNVGIRRAAGESVLATNIDILLSDQLFLASTEPLAERTVYRADRADVPFDPHVTLDPAVISAQSPVRVNRKDGIYYPGEGRTYPHVRGWRDLLGVVASDPLRFVKRLTTTSANSGRPGWARYRMSVLKVLALPLLHTNACGDFTLMTRAAWHELGGYPEWPFYSWNLDSLLLYQAAAAGFRFVDFEGEAYHMEHSAGWSPESHQLLFTRLEERGIPFLSDSGLAEVAHSLRSRGHERWRINIPDRWGLPDHTLDSVPVPAVL